MATVGASTSRGIILPFLEDAVDEIATLAFFRHEAKPVDVCLEAGKLAIEIPCVHQIILNRLSRLSDPLSRHDERYPWRIRHYHDREGPAHQVVDLDAFDATFHESIVGICWPQGHLRQGSVHVPLRLRQVILTIDVVDAFAEISQAQLAIGARVRRGYGGECAASTVR